MGRMKEQISWDSVGMFTKTAVVELCGWITGKGTTSATGKRIASTTWDALTPAARNVLINHGITK